MESFRFFCVTTCHSRDELQYLSLATFMLTKYEGRAGRLVKRLMSHITDVLVNNSASDDLTFQCNLNITGTGTLTLSDGKKKTQ